MIRRFYRPDGIEAGGMDSIIPDATVTGGTPAEPTPAPEQTEDKDPAWLSQLPKEMREDADTKAALSGYKNLSDLAQAYLNDKKDLDTAIRIPKKDASQEDIKAFLTKLGMPEDSSEYELDNYDMSDEQLDIPKKLFRDVAHSSGLTKQQAKNLWKCEVAMAKAHQNYEINHKKDIMKNFDPAYHKILEAEYPVEAERSKAMKGEVDLVRGFLSETGLGQRLKADMFIYDADSMHKLATYIKKHTASYVDGKPGNSDSKQLGAMGNYSQQFLEAAGKA